MATFHKYCPECGNPKNNPLLDTCDQCKNNDQADLKKIKQFLKENPNSNAMDITLNTNIPINKVMRYIEEGYLTLQAK